MLANFIQFLLSCSAISEFYLKLCVASYSRLIVSDFLEDICANGHKKPLLKYQLLEIASFLRHVIGSRLTNSVLVIWGLIPYSVFRQILPRKTVNAFCTASFTSQNKFSYKALTQQSRLSVIPY